MEITLARGLVDTKAPWSGFHDRHNSRIRASDFPQAASSRYLGPVVRGPHSPRTASRGSEVRGSGRVAAHPESISTVCVHASDYGGHLPTSAGKPSLSPGVWWRQAKSTVRFTVNLTVFAQRPNAPSSNRDRQSTFRQIRTEPVVVALRFHRGCRCESLSRIQRSGAGDA